MMMKPLSALFLILLALAGPLYAQEGPSEEQDLPLKILHAEPLFIDLIRDLGARRGEKEWNVGAALVDRSRFDSYEFLVEYEWAIRDRWGLEVEVPVTIFTQPREMGGGDQPVFGDKPSNRVESLKLATQYTFLVSGKHQASLAVGGIVEFEFVDLDRIQRDEVFKGMLYNPFFIAAKRLGEQWHSLIYTGPRITQHFSGGQWDFGYEVNTNVHYMLPNSRNFIGLEINKLVEDGHFSMVLRPQMRLEISKSLMIGIVPGIPISRTNERLSAFMRLIYEPSGH